MATEKTTYGIIGYPLKLSLSPLMHNTAFKELGVDAVYKILPLKEDQLPDFFSELHEKTSTIFGLNVTVPYKEKVISYLDVLSPFVEKAMAVNTIVINKERRLIGYNTDGAGFLSHLAELKFDPKGKRVAMLGAGGTARAILAVLCLLPNRPDSIKIYNRTPENLDRLIEDLSSRIDLSIVETVNSIDDLNIELADFLINTTSLGMKEGDSCLINEELFHSNLLVYDVIYNPAETKLLKVAKRRGAKTMNGLGMLFYQGVLAFQHWANVQLDEHIKSKMRESLIKGLKS